MRSASRNVSFFDSVPSHRTLKTQTVTFSSCLDRFTGFLVLANNPGRQPAVIAIHEWWGLNDWVKEQARNLATNGYIVLAVDLYRGKVTVNPLEARKLKRNLQEDHAIRDLKTAFDYLASRSDVDPRRISSIGWSMGGGLALQLAIHEPRLAACVVNYGPLPTESFDIQKICARVLGTFGSLDRGIPRDKVRVFEKQMKAAKKYVDIKIYDGAGHAFQNPSNKSGYRPEATADAWFRTLTFLGHAKQSKSLNS